MNTLAFDLGASSGRAIIGQFDGEKMDLNEIHRFPNDPVQVGNHLHWDILRLFHEIKQGILKTKHFGYEKIESMAIDSWAVDFGIIGTHGELLANPYHYRDHHTDGIMEEVSTILPKETIYSRTGIQFLSFNTLYQLYAMKKAKSPLLNHAETLLMIPDLLRYFLTGERKTEYTNATTTQFLNIGSRNWDYHLLEQLGLPTTIFADIIESGETVGTIMPSVASELNINESPVIAVGEHDTGSAVASVPAMEKDFAYLSCGTWSLLGTETDEPVVSEEALAWNFTNEGGVYNTYRFLTNIMGLWIIQECQRTWRKEGEELTYKEMETMIHQAKPFQSFIDPDQQEFLNPDNMPNQVQTYCRNTNQKVPQTKGEILRCVTESLALKYRFTLERIEKLTNKAFSGLHMVGGGTNNTLLCQYTANAIARPVWAGPTEASSIGNLLVQYIAAGEMKNLAEARIVVKNSFPIKNYEPQDTPTWNQAYDMFREVIAHRNVV